MAEFEASGPSDKPRREAAVCEHEFQFDAELEDWVCEKCGKALSLVTQEERHECGPDCDKHGDIAAIG